jgi:hypothetical protein
MHLNFCGLIEFGEFEEEFRATHKKIWDKNHPLDHKYVEKKFRSGIKNHLGRKK